MPLDHFGFWYPPTTVHPSQLHTPHPPGYAYSNPIPAFTPLTPCELLEDYYSDRRNDPDWTDPNGILSKQLEACLNYPHYTIASIGSAGLISEWPRPHDLPAEPVPVCWDLVESNSEIEFRNLDPDCPSAGVSLSDFYTSNSSTLVGADDVVLYGAKGLEMKFVIAWPGYQHQEFTISTSADDGAYLSRFELGRFITKAYARFFRKVESERLLPSKIGFYNIALHQGLNARSDSLGVQLLQLHLVKVRGMTDNTWIAEVDIV